MRAPRFFRIGTGHQTRRRPLASSFAPQTSFVRERCFVASCNRSLSPRPSGSLATLADRTRRAQCLRQPTVASCIPARWPQVTPGPVGHATAPNRELRRRDLHPQVQQPGSLHPPADASPAASRRPAHGSRRKWLADLSFCRDLRPATSRQSAWRTGRPGPGAQSWVP